MLPILAIIGRPNVGKSTLFNVLTRSRDALVYDQPGVTRDRQYGLAEYEGKQFWVIDTGGIAETDPSELTSLTDKQVQQAILEADKILFMMDAKVGLTPMDREIATRLRPYFAKTIIVVNKAEGMESNTAASDFFSLGVKTVLSIAAAHQRGIDDLFQKITGRCVAFHPFCF